MIIRWGCAIILTSIVICFGSIHAQSLPVAPKCRPQGCIAGGLFQHGSRIFVTTWSGGLFQSDDGGAHWIHSSLTVGFSGLMGAIRRCLSTVRWVCTSRRIMGIPGVWTSGSDPRSITTSASCPRRVRIITSGIWSVYYTSNDGASWTATGSLNLYLTSLLIQNSTFVVGTLDSGLYRSTDYGATWIRPDSGNVLTGQVV